MKINQTAREYWRSFEHLADSPQVQSLIEQEFPGYNPDELVSLPRRRFLKLLGASMALAGITLSGCRRWPKDKLLAYTTPPHGHMPGVPEAYASQIELNGVGQGVLVSSYDFRPIKIEGNPSDPFARSINPKIGAATHWTQASLLEMYDPDRSRLVVDRRGVDAQAANWEQFEQWLAAQLARLKPTGGEGLAFLSEQTSSLTVERLREHILLQFPKARWVTWEPLHRDNEIAGTQSAFGKPARPVLRLDQAMHVVLFDDDLLGKHPAAVRYAADWAKLRKTADEGRMSRVWCIESTLTNTGSVADIRLPARVGEIEAAIVALASRLGIVGDAPKLSAELQQLVDRVAEQLKAHRGSALVSAGAHLSASAHALVVRINAALDAIGKTIDYVALPPTLASSCNDGIRSLADDLKASKIDTLIILGGNPAFDAPADLDFERLIRGVANTVHLASYDNETGFACKWHLPRAHPLETWGDARAWDGTILHQQPLIQPLYAGRSVPELLALFSGEAHREPDALVRETFLRMLGETGFELAYRKVVHDGMLPGPGFQRLTRVVGNALPSTANTTDNSGFDLRFTTCYHLYDGRFANNGWLVEAPDPLTRLTWDNAAIISIADADELGLTTGDMVRISADGRSLDIAVYVLPGAVKGVIELPLGWGRRVAGAVGDNIGFDTFSLRHSLAPYTLTGAKISKLGSSYALASTQEHHLIDDTGAWGREQRIGTKSDSSGKIIKEATLAEYVANPKFVTAGKHGNLSLQLYNPPYQAPQAHPTAPTAFNFPHAWGMSIDMNACTGCNACVLACQAENNIPIVGKTHVIKNREMHWIRIDRYFKGGGDSLSTRMRDPNPQVTFQPMLCVHCENAPCEQVCPVAATVHDTEGLNTMVYNRCIGTRYCSNNCPYKVRRFNYLDYQAQSPKASFPRPWLGWPDSEQKTIDRVKRMVFNPDVTVRMRGVMEKCTFCVQRIKRVTIAARNAGKDVQDGQIITACQQTCPTQAIVFGNLNDPASQVTKLHQNPRTYSVLEDLNTRPRARHMARIRNVSDEA